MIFVLALSDKELEKKTRRRVGTSSEQRTSPGHPPGPQQAPPELGNWILSLTLVLGNLGFCPLCFSF